MASLSHISHQTDPVLGSEVFTDALFLKPLQCLQSCRSHEGHVFKRAVQASIDAGASVHGLRARLVSPNSAVILLLDGLSQRRVGRHLLEQVVHASYLATLTLAPRLIALLRLNPVVKLDVLVQLFER